MCVCFEFLLPVGLSSFPGKGSVLLVLNGLSNVGLRVECAFIVDFHNNGDH